MTYFAVTRAKGASWDPSRPMREQDRWDEHAAFMDGLAEAGFVVLGGPLGEERAFLLIVEAESAEEIEARLAEDPWTPMELLATASIERWQVLLRSA